MKLRATAMPIATPIPAPAATPTATAAATTVASISPPRSALIVTLPALTRLLSSTSAWVEVRITLVATAPAPLTPMPAPPPKPAAIAAANATTRIAASSAAVTVMLPRVVATSSASKIVATTVLLMVLNASPMPIATDTPAVRPNDAASETAPASASMVELLAAVTLMLPASMPAAPSPSIALRTSTPMVFSAYTPEPPMATPTTAPMPTAADPAITIESMVWSARALRLRLPAASTLVSFSTACTPPRTVESLGDAPMKLRATATPIDAPMPTDAPPPIATVAATTVASMSDALSAVSVTWPPLSITLSSACATVRPMITFCATAPAPLTAMPTPVPPRPTATDAATDTALIVLRETEIAPFSSSST